MYEVPVILNN